MRKKLFGVFAILLISTAVAGCKLEVVAVQGGDVSWSGGTCLEGNNCVIEITDPNFSDNFSVTPRPGYEFVKWQSGDGFLCGEETSSCAFTMPADADQAAAVIALFRTGYMMPVYEDVGFDTDEDGQFDRIDEDDDNDGLLDADDACPLVGPNDDGLGCPDTDSDGVADYLDACPEDGFVGQVYENGCPFGEPITRTVLDTTGTEWAFPADFRGLEWDAIAEACPFYFDGVGFTYRCNGELNGYDMEGWNFATNADIYGLYTRYLEAAGQTIKNCDPGNGAVGACAAYEYALLDDMLEDGFTVQEYEYAPGGEKYFAVVGWTLSGNAATPAAKPFTAIVGGDPGVPFVLLLDSPGFTCGVISVDPSRVIECEDIENNPHDIGAWFYRAP